MEISKSTRPTLEPVWKPFIDASAKIEVEAGVSFPVAIGIGATIPLLGDKGTFKVQLVEQPGVNAKAEYEKSTPTQPDPDEGGEGGDGDEGGEGGDGGDEEGGEGGGGGDEEGGEGGEERRDLIVAREGDAECKNGIKWAVKCKSTQQPILLAYTTPNIITVINKVYVEAILATYRKDHPLHTYEKEIAGGCYTPGGLKARDDWDPNDFNTVNEMDTQYDATENAGDIRLLDQAIAAVQAAQLDYNDYPTDVNFIMIQDFTKQFQILQDKDGYLQPGLATTKPVPGSVWAEDDGMVWADYRHRELKFDPNSMRANGWSNIQLGPVGTQVTDAEAILMVPARTGVPGKPYIYLAEVSSHYLGKKRTFELTLSM